MEESAILEPQERQAVEAPVVDAPPSTPATTLDTLAAMQAAAAAALREDFANLSRQFEARLAIDKYKDQLIDRLHEELQGYKADLLAKAMRPMIRSLIGLHDGSGKMAHSLRGRDPATVTLDRVIESLASFQDEVQMVLEEYEVTVYREPDDTFNPRRQRALKTVTTSYPSLANRIAERMRAGFELGGVILEKERVAVFVHDPALAAPPEPATPEPASSETAAPAEPLPEAAAEADGLMIPC